MKFYPRDWRGDQALRAVSIAARGFWMECICIMHEAKPYGHLILNGAPIPMATLARMTGVPLEEAESLLAELRAAGVFGTTRTGAIVSRRMIADFARAEKGRKAVEKRYGETIESVGETKAPSRLPTTQKPDTRYQIPERKNSPPKPPPPSQPSLLAEASEGVEPKKSLKAEFEEFYSAFPRHVGRTDAERAYARARRTADAAVILEGAKRYAQSRRAEDPKFTAHPATWLNAGRWQDEIAGASASVIFTQTDVNGWVERLKVFHHGQEADENGTFGYSIPAGTWATTYGPKPGQPGCKVPPEASTRYQDWLARSRTGKDRLQG